MRLSAKRRESVTVGGIEINYNVQASNQRFWQSPHVWYKSVLDNYYDNQ